MRRLRRASIRRSLFCCALALVPAGTFSPITLAQVLYGTIVGNVKDASEAGVPGATVTVTNKDTNVSRETITNEAGVYSLANVPAGTYSVKIILTGFKEF